MTRSFLDRTAGRLGWLALLVLTAVLFRRTIAGLFDRWWDDPAYAHGLLVPLVSLFFLLQRSRKAAGDGRGWAAGAVALAGAVLVYLAGRMGNMLFLQAIAMIACLGALVLLVEGWGTLRAVMLPIAYLVFMCPLPSGLYDLVSAKLRLFASAVSTTLLQLVGVPAAASGNIIYIPNATLSVEDACSGIRSLFGIIATATAFAFVVRGGWARKTAFILSSAPVAVIVNIMRVTGTGLLQHAGLSGLAEGFYHQLEGWVFYVLALLMLWGEYVVLKAVFPLPPAPIEEPQTEAVG